MSFLQCIKWAGLQPIFQNFLLRSWLLFSFTFLFITSSSKASANHSIALSTSALAREQRGVGNTRDDRNGSLVLSGFHPAHHLAAYELPEHPQWHLGFKHLFFSHFFLCSFNFHLLKEVYLALTGQPNPVYKRKANRKVAASRLQGRGSRRASTCNSPLQIFSSFQLFSMVCLASSPRGISLSILVF